MLDNSGNRVYPLPRISKKVLTISLSLRKRQVRHEIEQLQDQYTLLTRGLSRILSRTENGNKQVTISYIIYLD